MKKTLPVCFIGDRILLSIAEMASEFTEKNCWIFIVIILFPLLSMLMSTRSEILESREDGQGFSLYIVVHNFLEKKKWKNLYARAMRFGIWGIYW